jgi:hypothetical protein
MLNPNAQKLVDALRSGKYEQTTGCLRSEDSFCCLGVACDLAAEDVDGGWDGDWFDAGSGNRTDSVLSPVVCEWIGFRYVDGEYYIGREQVNLSGQNDRGKTFAEIADIIESEPKGLFA